MDLAEQILDALAKHEGLTAPELLEHCPEAEGNEVGMGSAIAQLRQENRIHWNGELRDQRQVYVVGPKPTQPSAAGQAPAGRAPLPLAGVRTVTPAPAADPIREEASMKKSDKIRDALKNGPLTSRQLRERTGFDPGPHIQSLVQRKEVLVDRSGGHRNTLYALASDKPASSPGKRKPNAAAPEKPKPAAGAANGNGAAQFAINAHGELGIEKEEARVRLTPDEFAQLRRFVEQTEPVWKAA